MATAALARCLGAAVKKAAASKESGWYTSHMAAASCAILERIPLEDFSLKSEMQGMKQTLSRYNECVDRSQPSTVPYEQVVVFLRQQSEEVNILKDEITKLRMTQLQMMGKEPTGLSMKELQHLEHILNEGIACVKQKKAPWCLQRESLGTYHWKTGATPLPYQW